MLKNRKVEIYLCKILTLYVNCDESKRYLSQDVNLGTTTK